MLIFVVTALQCALEGGERICQKEIYCKPWKFTSSDGRFEMDFLPILDRSACLDYKLIVSDQHQVFGRIDKSSEYDEIISKVHKLFEVDKINFDIEWREKFMGAII